MWGLSQLRFVIIVPFSPFPAALLSGSGCSDGLGSREECDWSLSPPGDTAAETSCFLCAGVLKFPQLREEPEWRLSDNRVGCLFPHLFSAFSCHGLWPGRLTATKPVISLASPCPPARRHWHEPASQPRARSGSCVPSLPSCRLTTLQASGRAPGPAPAAELQASPPAPPGWEPRSLAFCSPSPKASWQGANPWVSPQILLLPLTLAMPL